MELSTRRMKSTQGTSHASMAASSGVFFNWKRRSHGTNLGGGDGAVDRQLTNPNPNPNPPKRRKLVRPTFGPPPPPPDQHHKPPPPSLRDNGSPPSVLTASPDSKAFTIDCGGNAASRDDSGQLPLMMPTFVPPTPEKKPLDTAILSNSTDCDCCHDQHAMGSLNNSEDRGGLRGLMTTAVPPTPEKTLDNTVLSTTPDCGVYQQAADADLNNKDNGVPGDDAPLLATVLPPTPEDEACGVDQQAMDCDNIDGLKDDDAPWTSLMATSVGPISEETLGITLSIPPDRDKDKTGFRYDAPALQPLMADDVLPIPMETTVDIILSVIPGCGVDQQTRVAELNNKNIGVLEDDAPLIATAVPPTPEDEAFDNTIYSITSSDSDVLHQAVDSEDNDGLREDDAPQTPLMATSLGPIPEETLDIILSITPDCERNKKSFRDDALAPQPPMADDVLPTAMETTDDIILFTTCLSAEQAQPCSDDELRVDPVPVPAVADVQTTPTSEISPAPAPLLERHKNAIEELRHAAIHSLSAIGIVVPSTCAPLSPEPEPELETETFRDAPHDFSHITQHVEEEYAATFPPFFSDIEDDIMRSFRDSEDNDAFSRRIHTMLPPTSS